MIVTQTRQKTCISLYILAPTAPARDWMTSVVTEKSAWGTKLWIKINLRACTTNSSFLPCPDLLLLVMTPAGFNPLLISR